jgi:HlyD family secretion protein
MADPSIFRQSALDRLSSPEQLDRLMRITDPRGWIALAAIWALLLVAGVWSVVGRIPTTLVGHGILLTSGGILEAEVRGTGIVSELRVGVGDRVEAGQVIALISQPELEQRIEQANARLERARESRGRRVGFATENATLETGSLAQQRENLTVRLATGRETVAWLETRLAAEQEARRLGLITAEAVRSTTQLLETARSDTTAVHIALRDNALHTLQARNRASGEINLEEERILELEREVAALQLSYEESSRVVSAYAGTVQEIRARAGQFIQSGQSILSLERLDDPLEAVAFIPTEAKRIRPGMAVQVSPVTVKREEFGFMFGEVVSVSGQPSTPDGIMRVVGNPILVEQLSGDGAPFMVRIALERDPATSSGFRWSSRAGPPTGIESGTLFQARVILERQRPIGLVIPFFRTAEAAEP